MTEKEFKELLEDTDLEVTYHSWPIGQAPELPYLVYRYPQTDNFNADDTVYQQINNVDVELYTNSKDFATEKAVEAVLDGASIPWQKSENYIETERMYQTVYEMEILIDG